MKIFITGATGYIGFSVAKTFRQEGHEVWGLTRSREKANDLARDEIIPVIGDMLDVEKFSNIIATSDVIIHAAVDYKSDTATLDAAAVEILLDIAHNPDQPKTLIYTSGVWVYGSSQGQTLDNNSPLDPIEEVAWRPAVEETVLKADAVNGLVIRPAVVYGKSGGMTGAWFEDAFNNRVVQIVGNGHNRWTMVHVDDLAKAYLLAASSGLRGEAFDIVDDTQFTAIEMASAAAQATDGSIQLKFIPLHIAEQEMGAYAEALALDQVVDASKTKRLLGWQPKHKGFILEVETYYRAWQASQLAKENSYGTFYS